MDKGVQKDIRLSWCSKHKEWWVMNCPNCMAETVDQEWEELGFRKLPEGQPPLLAKLEIAKTFYEGEYETGFMPPYYLVDAFEKIAEAQREADIKFYTGKP